MNAVGRRNLVITGFLVLLVSPGAWLGEWLAVHETSMGGDWLIGFGCTLFVLSTGLGVTLLAFVFFIRERRWEYFLVLVCVGIAVALLPWFTALGEAARREGFQNLAMRSRSLIDAIHSYERDHGKPPVSLDALVPAYLPRVPETGMPASPHYDYLQGWLTEKGFGDSPWALQVRCRNHGLGSDAFIYLPSKEYPESVLGGKIERVGDWAYVRHFGGRSD